MSNEMKEAVEAGERALSSLRMVQEKLISKAKEQASDAIYKVEQIRNELKKRM